MSVQICSAIDPSSVDGVSLCEIVRRGLCSSPKFLPPVLFYDSAGSELFERITLLPEYYLSSAEKAIFERFSDAIVGAVRNTSRGPVSIVELGAGTASKTQILLGAFSRLQGRTYYYPGDVSQYAVLQAKTRIERDMPGVVVYPTIGTHSDTLNLARMLETSVLVMFVGSSIGNYSDSEAIEILSEIRKVLVYGGTLLLGVDLYKEESLLVQAYNDSAGVTAAFNKNILGRVNREMGAAFDLSSFTHVACWNEAKSRIEMYLESNLDQSVHIAALGESIFFCKGERIHTESSHKYTESSLDSLLRSAGLERFAGYTDDRRRFMVSLIRPLS